MSGFDDLGADEVGVDYMQLLKGGAGLLSGAGEMMNKGDKKDDKKDDKDKQRLEDLERRASTLKIVLVVLGVLTGVGLVGWVVAGRRQ